MKITTVAKISPIIETLSPILLQCKSGECGGCPNNTGKMLWVPLSLTISGQIYLNFQYNFFDKSAESTSPIKFNVATGFNTLNSTNFSYENPPNRTWAMTMPALDTNPSLSPSLMRGVLFQTLYAFYIQGTGGWLFFRQPNPAIANVHDALCFEYNNEKRLITFRSF